MSDSFISPTYLFLIGISLIIIVIVTYADFDDISLDGITEYMQYDAVVTEDMYPDDLSHLLVKSASTPVEFGHMRQGEIDGLRAVISNIDTCDAMTDAWKKNTAWTFRPELAQRILDECQ